MLYHLPYRWFFRSRATEMTIGMDKDVPGLQDSDGSGNLVDHNYRVPVRDALWRHRHTQ